MHNYHQLLVRIKSFLNSSELIDSPTARELYSAYCQLSNQTARRLVESEILLQKKQKIEAVVLAQQVPPLLDVIDSLQFPERKLFMILADLYDWTMPDEISGEAVRNLRKAISGMDDLRPLLTEFRRIARTDQVNNKLHLLREIYRIDHENPEWKQPLTEVENQYVSKLITEAQQMILNKDFNRLEEIYEEFRNSSWHVTIPTIVLQKIEKLVVQHRNEVIRKTAADIMEKINFSYAAFDLPALEDAIFCWNEHCKKYNYTPGENEALQFREANAYLMDEKKKQKALQEHLKVLDHVIALINGEATLQQVEKEFSAARGSGFDIPDHITERVEKYRRDIERERRMGVILKSMKIIGCVTVLIVIIISCAVWAIQIMTEKSLAGNLEAAVKSENIDSAHALLREIENKYPELAGRSEIARAKASLHALEEKEKARIREFEKLTGEFDSLKKQWPPDKNLKNKLARLQKIARSNIEKNHVEELRYWIEDTFKRYAAEADELYLKKIALLKQQRDELLESLKKEDFFRAEKVLAELENTHREISAIKDVNKDLTADNGELMKSVLSMRTMFLNRQMSYKERAQARKNIIASGNLTAMEIALQTYEKKLDTKADKAELDSIKASLNAISCLKEILKYQSSRFLTVSEAFSGYSYFADIPFYDNHKKTLAGVYDVLKGTFDSLQKNVNKRNLVFVRLKSGSSFIDIYADSKRLFSMLRQERYDITLHDMDGRQIVLSAPRTGKTLNLNAVSVSIDGTVSRGCSLVYPGTFTTRAIRESRAPHQILIEKFFRSSNRSGMTDPVAVNMAFLKEIWQSEFCSMYWKMRLAVRILEPLAGIDLSPDKTFVKLNEELQKLMELDNAAGDPLKNKFLAEKTELFFKKYDFSVLQKAYEQNKCIRDFYSACRDCKLQYLGVAVMEEGQLKFVPNSKFRGKSAEILCFDGDNGKCIVVGKYDKNGFLIDGKYRNKIAGRILFTSVREDFFNENFSRLKITLGDAGLQNIVYPEFWPVNLRGESEK